MNLPLLIAIYAVFAIINIAVIYHFLKSRIHQKTMLWLFSISLGMSISFFIALLILSISMKFPHIRTFD